MQDFHDQELPDIATLYAFHISADVDILQDDCSGGFIEIHSWRDHAFSHAAPYRAWLVYPQIGLDIHGRQFEHGNALAVSAEQADLMRAGPCDEESLL
jgi:hypothetical protein